MSLAKLTSLSTSTLSLLLERQRLQTLSPPTSQTKSLHHDQITRNLRQLRAGVLLMEDKDGRTEAVKLLRSQYGRMRGMLGPEAEGVEGMESLQEELPAPSSNSASSSRSRSASPVPQRQQPTNVNVQFAPYKDDPEAGPSYEDEDHDPGVLLQTQKRMMDEQDAHLDNLSRSVNRQRDISLHINSELDVHTGLLEELDHDLDHTEGRLSGARKRLDKFARGIRGNGSTATIAILILVLLILIIVFKT
ncbi:hypothetical protein JAAARDRAFT_40741 [Jaapia argillacea MUCL 33604]|uniref:t-SNARE coiled-coil homology domain-containing protein n=1 Tax=Jaapia argillacea MUCL 33604 TaxID=933084 RepID=A0A067PAY0_9AGAM|nr:hypothetical protein JAAARDRAFT_40741 [Jaapia argillacea MUCL 33604]